MPQLSATDITGVAYVPTTVRIGIVIDCNKNAVDLEDAAQPVAA
jgi:hypothetical protein